MKSKLIILMTVLVAAFLVGCSSDVDGRESRFGGGGSSSSESSGGLNLEFAENNPPQRMFKGNPYTFAMIFRNNQEHPISDLTLRTRNFDRSFVSGLDEEYSIEEIPQASEQIGPGIRERVIDGVILDGFTGDYNFDPTFDYCYTARTKFTQTVCVPSTTNVCDTEISRSQTQNGPLTVTIDSINHLDNTVRIDFKLSDSGNGQVVNECFNVRNYASEYFINSVRLGTSEGNCQPSGSPEFLLGDSRGSFYCEFDRTSDESYGSQVRVDLEYKYQQSVRRSILVEDMTR